MKLKRIFTLAVAICMSLIVFVGCGPQDYEVDPYGRPVLHLLWDQLTFVLGNDLPAVIESDRASIAAGLFPDPVRSEQMIFNTEVMIERADARGVALRASNLGWNQMLTQSLLQSFMVGYGPDVIQGEEQLPDFIRRGYLVPFPEDLAARIRETVSPIAFSGLETNGKLYGLAINPGVTLLYWNRAILRQAFPNYVTDETHRRIVYDGPRDWAEWEHAMYRVDRHVGAYRGIPRAGGVYVGPNPGGYLRVGALMDANGGYFADAQGRPAINTPENRETFEFIRRKTQFNSNGIINASAESTYTGAFRQGEIAYMVCGSWMMHELTRQGMDFGVSLLPPRVAGGRPGTFTIGAAYMAVPTYTPHRAHAFYLIEAMLDQRIQDSIASVGFRLPVLKDSITSEEFRDAHPRSYEFANFAMNNTVRGLPPFDGRRVSDIWFQMDVIFSDIFSFVANPHPVQNILDTAQGRMMTAYNTR